ncbi:hypothetical protein MF1_11560 [Bartonella quintana]|nr:hypothetical protein MF1_11560 [Bartonella quintana]
MNVHTSDIFGGVPDQSIPIIALSSIVKAQQLAFVLSAACMSGFYTEKAVLMMDRIAQQIEQDRTYAAVVGA